MASRKRKSSAKRSSAKRRRVTKKEAEVSLAMGHARTSTADQQGTQHPRGFKGMPEFQVTKHKYFRTFQIASTSGVDSVQFRLNSAYAPYAGGSGGGQPRGYDEMATFYSEYCILGAKAKVWYLLNGTHSSETVDQVEFVFTGALPHGSGTVPDYLDEIYEHQDFDVSFLGKQGTTNDQNQGQRVVHEYKWSAARAQGYKNAKALMAESKNWAGVGASPATTDRLVVGIGSGEYTFGTNTWGAAQIHDAVQVVLDLEYIIAWRQPKRVADS